MESHLGGVLKKYFFIKVYISLGIIGKIYILEMVLVTILYY